MRKNEIHIKNTLIHAVRAFAGWLVVITFVVGSAGCAPKLTRNPLPQELSNEVVIPGVPDARFWGDEWTKYSLEILKTYTEADIQQRYSAIYKKTHNYLAISGGGANGAFGAGLLVGWTETGTRPEFTMVTGISTGALAAPFAFLGPDYDDELKEVYTTVSTEMIAEKRKLMAAVFGDSMTDTRPMREVIAGYIHPGLIEAIAKEHRRGRRLMVGTVNLDAGRSVIWNIGAIAASDFHRKMELIHDVLLASASVPVVFPPVMIPVEANGVSYDEMHVDGGTGSQVFVYPAAADWKRIMKKSRAHGKPRIFVIRNAFLEPDYGSVERKLLPIGIRTIDTLIRTQGIGDLYQIYALCVRDGNDFNLAYIPEEFTEKPAEGFDPEYMGKLFDLGYELAKPGYPWQKWPPGFHAGMGEQ
jgi:predicted patatin/cPLA2 family phospholipase